MICFRGLPRRPVLFFGERTSDGSDPRIGLGLARDWPFLKGLGSNFREGPKLGIGSGSMSRIEEPEGPEDLL